MGRSVRRLAIGCVVLALAACDPSPIVTRSPAPTTAPTAVPTASAGATSAPASQAPSPVLSGPPTSVDLPDGFDAIPWARMPITGDEDSITVSIGVLGKPATTTRTFTHQPWVWADGHAVLLEVDGKTEIVDAASGQTTATYDRDALALDDVPTNNLSYHLFGHRFTTDVARGYLYLLSGNRDGVQLRRFDLDGSHETLLAVVAPDPGRRSWYSDFTLTPEGEVVATACPTDTEQAANFRCRIYEIAPGTSGPFEPRYLPLRSSRPCLLLAADETHVFANADEHCRADGGPPAVMTYMKLDRATLQTAERHATSGLRPFGVIHDEIGVGLVGNLGIGYPYPRVYPAIGAVLRFEDARFSLDSYVPDGDEPDQLDEYPGYAWAIAGRGSGWTLLHGFGPEYAACRIAALDDPSPGCASGPVILETTEGRYILPPGTWGEYVPPQDLPGF